MYLTKILERAARQPDATCFITEERRISLAELAADFDALAVWLTRQGLGPGDAVGVSIKDGYRHLVAALALMRIGAGQIGLPTHEPQAYRSELAARIKAVAVLAEDERPALDGLPTLIADFEFTAPASALPAPADHAPSLYMASSGTTGRAKIVPLTQAQMHRSAARYHAMDHPGIFYRPVSSEHNIGKKARLTSLAVGQVHLIADPGRWPVVEAVRAFGVTSVGVSAAQVRGLIDGAGRGRKLPKGTRVTIGGSPVSQALRREITETVTPDLHIVYATSEFGTISVARPDHHDGPPDCLGPPVPGVELGVVDEADRPVPPGVVGLLRMRAAGMVGAYFDDPVASAKAFRNGWFYPGDAGRVSQDGLLYFAGRADDMFILASINIFPAEIERVVEGLPAVRECAAFAVKSRDFGDIPLVAVVPQAPITADEVLAHAKSRLGLKAPRKVFVVDALPLTGQGKVDRAALQAMAKPG